MRRKRITHLKVLKGQPTDGSGKVCIHLFVQDEKGLFTEPHVLHPALSEDGQVSPRKIEAKATRGRLACDRKRDPKITMRGNTTMVTMRTDDPRAATCPKCIASADYKTMMTKLTPSNEEK